MGRSVSYLNNAEHIAYINLESSDDEIQNQDDWDWFKEDLIETLRKLYPSFETNFKPEWDGNEVQIILWNGHSEIGLSEYCGLVSVSIRVNKSSELEGLAYHWIDQVWGKIEKALDKNYDTLRKIATASNGESFFEKIK